MTREVWSLEAREVKRGMSLRSMADTYGISHLTLHHFVIRKQKTQKQQQGRNPPLPPVGYSTHKKDFYIRAGGPVCYLFGPYSRNMLWAKPQGGRLVKLGKVRKKD